MKLALHLERPQRVSVSKPFELAALWAKVPTVGVDLLPAHPTDQ